MTNIGSSVFSGCSSLKSATIGTSVKEIGNSAFYNCSALTSITIPNSVTSIGEKAFEGCSSLASVSIGNGVTSIGRYAFRSCSSLTSITIPNSVTKIGDSAFSGCSGLTSVTIGNSVTSIGGSTFYGCSSLTSITIPNNVTVIKNGAFYNCSSLTSVTIGNSVTNIGSSAFSKCSSLTSVIWNAENYADFSSYAAAPFYNVNKTITSFTFGDNVRHIPTYLCYYMNQLTSITIPHSVTSIGEGAFYNCSSLTKTNYTGDVTSWCKINFGSYAANPIYYSRNFYINDQEIKDLVIPNTVDKIPNSAFENCSSLTSVTIGNSVTSIGNYAFGDCSSLTSVTIGNSVTSIGYNAFDDCSSLTSVTIPNSVTSIGDNAFEYCYGLTKTNYTGNVASWCKIKFGNYEANPIYYSRNFYINDQEIKDLVVPNIVDTIHNYAFCNCRSLKSITIPNGVKSIGDDAFYGCYSLISINVDDENVVYDSRNNCNAIIETANNTLIRGCQNTLIPNGITKILNNAFSWDIHMDTIYVEATIPPILGDESDDDFEFPGSYESICIIPYGTLEAYQSSSWANYVNYFIEQVGTRDSDIKWIMNGGSVADTLPTSLTASYKLSNTPTREGYGFIGWYDNPEGRGLALTILPAGYKGTLYAIWVGATLNSCGDHCYWRYLDNILTITGTGAMYDYTPSNPTPWDNYRRSDIHTISLSEGLTSIGGWAFGECESITSITIPNSVTNIGDKAFWGCRKLDSIVVPNSVIHIGERAFYSCVRLTSITLPDNLTSIEKYLLGYCSALVSVVIPENVTTIGEMALAYCPSLSAITIPENVNYIEWGAFYGSNNIDSVVVEATVPPAIGERGLIFSSSPTCYIPCGTLSVYQSSAWAEQVGSFIEQCDEPVVDANKCGDNLYWAYTDGTLTITGTGAMYNYDFMDNLAPWNSVSNNIKNIVLPEGLTSIGEWAFYLCSSVTSISIPEGVTSIGVRAFCNCSSLTSISIPNSVTSVGERAFYNCYNLASVTLSTNLSKIDKYLFGQCRTLTAITIPNNVTAIENGAFSGCSSLDSVSIEAITPPTLGDGGNSFSSSPTCYIPCGTLAAYQPSSWAEQVGSFVEQCDEPVEDNKCGDNLYWAYADGTLTITGTGAMYDYWFDAPWWEKLSSYIKTIALPQGLTSIGEYAFWDLQNLTSVVIPEGVTSIGKGAFSVCPALKSIVIPNSVINIGDNAFSSCESLQSINIPNGLITISRGIFKNCSSLTSVAIPNSVTTIKNSAFYNCSHLSTVIIPSSTTTIENGAFYGCSSLDSISIEATNPPVLSGSSTFSSSPTCYIPCGTLAVYQSSSWAEQVGGFVEQCDDNDNNQSLISVTDGTLSDWDNLPMEYLFETKCVEGASWDALKSVKVYADLTYINLVVEWDTDIVTDLSSVPFHVYLNVDNDAPTGGWGGLWLEPYNIDVLLEGYFYLDGNPCAYQPDVALYTGTPLADEWAWDWTTIEALAASQLITKGVMEIQIEYGKLPIKLENTFTVGFDIQQSWNSVGVLPNAAADEVGNMILAEKMLVRINNVNAPTSIENTHSPSSITNTHKLLRNGQLIILHDGKTYTVMGAEIH